MSDLYLKMPAIGWDTETHPMGMCNLCPKLVVLAMSAKTDSGYYTDLASATEKEKLDANIDFLVHDRSNAKIGHNVAFDLAVIAAYNPALIPDIFKALEDGIFEDTIIREKMLHLADHGNLEFLRVGDTGVMKLEYGLALMAKRYLGKDRSEDKKINDSWRTHYNVLEGQPVANWPVDAVLYVSEDAEDTLAIREIQESERLRIWKQIGQDPLKTQDFRVAVSFALYLMGAWGLAVDPVAKEAIEKMLTESLAPEKMLLLVKEGILRPGIPPQPFKNGAKNPDGTPKLKAAEKESIDTKKLKAYVEAYCAAKNTQVKKTAPSERYPEGQTSTDSDFMEDHWANDPIFEEYYNRQKLQKLVTTELPRMQWNGQTAAVVHPSYDVLKMTGRISSFASKIYPSFNCTNVDPRVRGCFVPRPGHLLFSIDYTGMELASLAQKCYSLFGQSVLRDKINAGIDTHAYLGSQLAYHLDDNFQKSCIAAGVNDPDTIFNAFSQCAKSDKPELKKFYKHYRTFAKPTGLGFPGGLGPDTFVAYAKGTYGVSVDLETAKSLRQIWHSTYPEMQQYFNWITNCCRDLVDPNKFAYSTPMGLYRAGANFCAAANGAALQALSAEGALLSVFNVIRACYDPTCGSILGDDDKGPTLRPICFIHDEILGEVRDDEKAHDRVHEAARIMVEAMRVVTPDVEPRAQPVLMQRWNKAAEPVYNKDGRLTVWKEGNHV